MYAETWYALDSPQIEECCDCGLVHHVEFKLENGRIFWRAVTDPAATKAARKRDGVKVIRGKTKLP